MSLPTHNAGEGTGHVVANVTVQFSHVLTCSMHSPWHGFGAAVRHPDDPKRCILLVYCLLHGPGCNMSVRDPL